MIPFTRLLPLRAADILVTADPSSPQEILYGPNYTHTALYLGGDTDGTPLVAEAVTSSEAGTLGQVRSLPLEETLAWGSNTIAAFRPIASLSPSGSTRASIVQWAKNITSQALPYWGLLDLALPVEACLDWNPIFHIPLNPVKFWSYMAALNQDTQSTNKFICSTLVWHSYLAGTGGTLDISKPNNMSIAPKTILGALPCAKDGVFLQDLAAKFIVPETFVRSPKLQRVF